jgi:hypothetical protein
VASNSSAVSTDISDSVKVAYSYNPRFILTSTLSGDRFQVLTLVTRARIGDPSAFFLVMW